MTTVSTIMTTKVISVAPELPLERLIRLLVDHNVSGVPVVDKSGRPIGMVSRSDLISDDYAWAESRESMPWQRIAGQAVADDAELFSERNLAARTVEDLMTTAALEVSASATIREAAQMMINHHVHRLPVIDEGARMVGIVTTFDIARWVARS